MSRDGEGFEYLIGALLAGAVVAVAILFVAIVTEIGRIYLDRAWGKNTTAARILWIAAAVLLVVWTVAGLVSADPALASLAAYVSTWSFLAFCVVCEAVDWHEQKHDEEQLAEAGEMDTYLSGFSPTGDSQVASPIGRVEP